MGEKLTDRQLRDVITKTEEDLFDTRDILVHGWNIKDVLGMLRKDYRLAVEGALEQTRLQGRLEAYQHVQDGDKQPETTIIVGIMEGKQNG